MIKRTINIENAFKISVRDNQLVLKLMGDDPIEKTVPIEDIALLVIEHPQTVITHQATLALNENNVAIIHCDNTFMPVSMNLPLKGHNTFNERSKFQIETGLTLKKALWQQTVSSKIQNQFSLLSKQQIPAKKMDSWSKQVLTGDLSNLEGRAAVFYWKNIFRNPDFIRDPEIPGINQWLNYGYAILRSVTARSLVGSGLYPSIGIFHKNKYNAYCLADDIMEPYRPFVDELIIDIRNQGYNTFEFTREVKVKLLKIPTLDVEIEGKSSPLLVAMSRTTSSLADCYMGKLRKIRFPKL